MAQHTVQPESTTTHGYFSADLLPILTVAPGDSVIYSLPDAAWNYPGLELNAPDDGQNGHGVLNGHCLVGPVAVNGARAGQALVVEVGEIIPESEGWTLVGGWDSPGNAMLGISGEPAVRVRWQLDTAVAVCRSDMGIAVPMQPFLGVMAVAPRQIGQHSTTVPRRTGGNLDCRELCAGAVLYLPIEVDGALFSCGDGHAAQGDGEIGGTAIECPIQKVTLHFDLDPEPDVDFAWARTPSGLVTFGLHEDLDAAAFQAAGAMLDLLAARRKMTRKQAAALASVAVDLRVTQVVNGVLGVHAVLPWDRLDPKPAAG